MIYLFDDNKYNQLTTNYKFDFLEYFSRNSEFITYIKSHDDYKLEPLFKLADCILLHQSFPDEIKTGKIKALCKKENVPLVIFSNQYTGTIYDDAAKNHIKQIKKDRMYFNFQYFIENYIEKGEVNLELLAMGKNYEIEKALIIQDRLSVYLFLHENNFDFFRCFEEEETEWKELKELLFLAQPTKDFDAFQEEIEKISAPELTQIIKSLTTKILDKHGY